MNLLIILLSLCTKPPPYVVKADILIQDTSKIDTVYLRDTSEKEILPIVCYDVVFANQARNRSGSFVPSLERLPRAKDFSAVSDTSSIEYQYTGCVEQKSTINVNLGSEYYYLTTVTSNQVTTQQSQVISSGFILQITPLKIDTTHLLDYNLTVRSPVTDGQSYQTSSINQRTRIPWDLWVSLGDVKVETWQRRFQWLGFLLRKETRNVRILVRVRLE